MKEDIKKTAKVYGTVSEEKILEKALNIEDVTEELLDVIDAPIEEIIAVKKEEPRQRGRRNEPSTAELIEAWNPRTKLGKDVKSGKIKNIDEIIDANKKILEPEIVDKLIPVQADLVAMGQSKGKFGGGKRRAWRQTQRVKKEGNVLTFSAMAVIGDQNGHLGIGVGKSNETLPARDKATRKAKLNVIKIKRGCSAFDCSCDEPHSLPFEVEGKSGSVRIKLIPAPQGTGLVVAKELKKVLKLAGIKDVYSHTNGKVRTTFNAVKACIDALQKTNRRENK